MAIHHIEQVRRARSIDSQLKPLPTWQYITLSRYGGRDMEIHRVDLLDWYLSSYTTSPLPHPHAFLWQSY